LWRFKNGHGVPDKADLGSQPGIVLAGFLQKKLTSLMQPVVVALYKVQPDRVGQKSMDHEK
jgi:hypothetical protein